MQRQRRVSREGDGLEALRAHQRAEPRAAGHAAVVAQDGGEAYALLPGRPDTGDTGRAVPCLRPNAAPAFRRCRSCPRVDVAGRISSVPSWSQRYTGSGDLPGDPQPIVSGRAQLRPQKAADVRLRPTGPSPGSEHRRQPGRRPGRRCPSGAASEGPGAPRASSGSASRRRPGYSKCAPRLAAPRKARWSSSETSNRSNVPVVRSTFSIRAGRNGKDRCLPPPAIDTCLTMTASRR